MPRLLVLALVAVVTCACDRRGQPGAVPVREAFFAPEPTGGAPRLLLRCAAEAAVGDAAAWLPVASGDTWIELVAHDDRSAGEALAGAGPFAVDAWRIGLAYQRRVNDWRPYDGVAVTALSGVVVAEARPAVIEPDQAPALWRTRSKPLAPATTSFAGRCLQVFASQPWADLLDLRADDRVTAIAWLGGGEAIIGEDEATRRHGDGDLALLARIVERSGAHRSYLRVPVRLLTDPSLRLARLDGLWRATAQRSWLARACATRPGALGEARIAPPIDGVAIARVSPQSKGSSGKAGPPSERAIRAGAELVELVASAIALTR